MTGGNKCTENKIILNGRHITGSNTEYLTSTNLGQKIPNKISSVVIRRTPSHCHTSHTDCLASLPVVRCCSCC